MRAKRVLIVDDSQTMRRLIRSILSADKRLEIVGEAETASEARDAVNRCKPDVMTLDVEMPNMSGVEFLKRLMRHRPMPVVMVSTLTRKGSDIAIEAMSLGAIECVEKPRLGADTSEFSNLAETVFNAAQARVAMPVKKSIQPNLLAQQTSYEKICLIGGSTGAVDAIERILLTFPEKCPPTLITQHMPEPFLASFAARLNPLVAPKVALARNGAEISEGHVYIAPGGAYHLNLEGVRQPVLKLVEGPPVSGHRPSVDSMFLSAKKLAPKVVACILTGMGKDGAEGLRTLQEYGANTIAQTKETCVVFGMPRVAGELGAVGNWVDLDEIGGKLLSLAATKVGVS